MQAQVLKWGNSLAVRIPRPAADDAKLKVGDPLEITVSGEGRLQIHKVHDAPTLDELISQITPENRYEEISCGTEVGREIVEW